MLAQRCELLVRALASVGIIALVDEATGYQQIRAQQALATILEQFIDKELQPWSKTFPQEFYEQIFRLNGWKAPESAKKPQVIGHYTNDIVYARLAPAVLNELKRVTPTLPSGARRHRHHPWFTPEIGHPRPREHPAAVIALMRVSRQWDDFMLRIQQAFPVYNQTCVLPYNIP